MEDAVRRRIVRSLKESSSYVKAHEDVDFLNRAELRPVRLQLELLKPELAQQEQDIDSTIVVFGGTRVREAGEAQHRIRALERRVRLRPRDKIAAAELRIARRILAKSRYYDEARKFAALVSSTCQLKGRRHYVIVTGGGPGIMEAANRGAYDVGAKSIGLNITLPQEQAPNPYISPELCFQFRYFALRKMHFMLRARALVAFPGGYGTMDELFEALTLVQTKKVTPMPIVLVGREFWTQALNFQFLVDEGVIDPDDAELVQVVDSASDAWDYIKAYYGEEGVVRTE
jgi:uncharacterized protein (TIGR00730 family)